MEKLARKTRKFLEDNCKELDLHIISRFPTNSCETTSLLLGKIISDKYPNKDVLFVKGTNSKKYEMHFWVEVDDYTFDITADQFPEMKAPLFGESSKVMLKRFDSLETMTIHQALIENDFANTKVDQFNSISAIVRNEI
ncbi:hypothetical protein AB4615_02140 [Vibrio splendidus]